MGHMSWGLGILTRGKTEETPGEAENIQARAERMLRFGVVFGISTVLQLPAYTHPSTTTLS